MNKLAELVYYWWLGEKGSLTYLYGNPDFVDLAMNLLTEDEKRAIEIKCYGNL